MKFTNNFLICLTGLPASGKSTFARKLKKIIVKEQKKYEVAVIDPDIIRSTLMGESFDSEKEHIVRKKNLEQIKASLQENKIVISDDINYYTSMRHELKEIAINLRLPFFIVHISTPLKICLEWNRKRGKPIPNEVICTIADRFDMFDKYKWESPDLIIDMSKVSKIDPIIYNFLKYIDKQLRKISPTGKEKSTSPEKTNYREELDSITRSIVGEFLRQHKQFKKRKKLLKARKQFIKMKLDENLSHKAIETQFKEFLRNSFNLDLK
ncbi:MAG: L-seryl-tRNA(Sec) kinase [Promethearchaeota archaeon]|nr:MAG: L-seryl-tRNA(Sec) kinase [Candidatus Lokiarchaeota archaeon]